MVDADPGESVNARDVLGVDGFTVARRTRVAGEDGRVEQTHLIDQAGGERGLVERRAGFEQDAQDVAAGELGEDCAQIGMRR